MAFSPLCFLSVSLALYSIQTFFSKSFVFFILLACYSAGAFFLFKHSQHEQRKLLLSHLKFYHNFLAFSPLPISQTIDEETNIHQLLMLLVECYGPEVLEVSLSQFCFGDKEKRIPHKLITIGCALFFLNAVPGPWILWLSEGACEEGEGKASWAFNLLLL